MSKSRVALIAIAVVLALVSTACRPTAADNAASACLNRTPPPTVLSGTYTSRWSGPLATNGVADARQASFVGLMQPGPGQSKNAAPIKLESTTDNTCFVDGVIQFTDDFTTTKWSVWHDSYAMTINNSHFTSAMTRIRNAGDGIAFTQGADDFWVIGANFSQIHDDCVQNDSMRGGVIEDSYLECYSGVSARGYAGYEFDGSGRTLTVKNSLLYAKAMPETYLDNGQPGHIGWFKFSTAATGQGQPPLLNLQNVTLRVDTAPLPGHSLNLPPTYKDASNVVHPWPMTCSNVTIVWTGSGSYPGTYPSCATVTTDVSVWNNAVATYNTDHPDNQQ